MKELDINFQIDRRLKSSRIYRRNDGSIEVRSPTRLSPSSKSTIAKKIKNGEIGLPQLRTDVKYPESITVPLLSTTFEVSYYRSSSESRRIQIDGERVLLRLDTLSEANELIGTFLKTIGREPLSLLLNQHLASNGYGTVPLRIGLPKGRWASRSSSSTISLNARLMLLERPLIESVILHEIAHISQMNHSKAFYDHLAELNPNYREHRRMVKAAEANFEPWVREIR